MDFNIGGINIPPHETATEPTKSLTTSKLFCLFQRFPKWNCGSYAHKKLPKREILHLEEGIF
jgi:hypothetical protein